MPNFKFDSQKPSAKENIPQNFLNNTTRGRGLKKPKMWQNYSIDFADRVRRWKKSQNYVDVMDGLNFLPYVASLLYYHLHQTVPLAARGVDFPKLPILRHDDGVGEVHRDSQRV